MATARNNLSILYLAVKSLVPYAKNARTHSAAQVAQIAKSIEKFGFTNPILADGKNGVIAGHGRLLAAAKLGMAKVPVIALAGLSDADKRALVLADNKLALNAGWDEDMLRLELSDLTALGVDLDLTGFSAVELSDLTALGVDLDLTGFSAAELSDLMGGGGGNTDPDEVPAAPTVPVVRLGELWHLAAHRLLIDDSTDPESVKRLLAGASPLLMITDPPYGVSYNPAWRGKAKRAGTGKRLSLGVHARGEVKNDDNADWRAAWALFPGDVAYVWHAGVHGGSVQDSLEDQNFVIRSQIIWVKNNLVIGRGDYHWQHEPCLYAVRDGKPGHYLGGRKQTTVWEIDKPQKSETGHGTQKPVECMRRPILNNSRPGQAVYDPFLGSGTTLIAAQMENRICFGMEIDPAYGQVIIERWQAFTGKTATREDGATLEDLKDGKTSRRALRRLAAGKDKLVSGKKLAKALAKVK